MLKIIAAALIAAFALSAEATTGTTTLSTINTMRVVNTSSSTNTIFTLTGVTSAGTCPTAALDGTNTLVVWIIPTGAGSGNLTQAQLEGTTEYDRLWGTIKSAQLNGVGLILNWDDTKTFGTNSYCQPQYVQ